jgi:hypothetical protein
MPPAPPQPYPQATAFYPPMYYSRVARHVHGLGIIWLVYALYYLLKRLFAFSFLHAFLGSHHEFPFNGVGIWPFAFGSTLLTLALSLIAAYGLMNRQSWGRVMAIVSAVFALVHPVAGTLVGIYTLWVLAPAASGLEYAAMTTPMPPVSAAPPPPPPPSPVTPTF